jgi:hypothetical protein
MKMKMKTKNGKKKAVILDDKEENIQAYEDRVAEKMLYGGGRPVSVSINNRLSSFDVYKDDFDIILNNYPIYNPDLLNRFIDILGDNDRNDIPATLELDENDKDLRNLSGSITIRRDFYNLSNIEFSFSMNNESIDKIKKIKDKVMNAYYNLVNNGSNIYVGIYPRNLASTPIRYTLALNDEEVVRASNDEGVVDEALNDEGVVGAKRNVRRSIRAKQTGEAVTLGMTYDDLKEIRALLESENVGIKKEKGLPKIRLESYVLDGMNVNVDLTANGDMVMTVKSPNVIIQSVSNGVAGLTNGITNRVERLSGDRVTIDADFKKSYQQYFKVDNKIKEMNFKKMRTQLMKLSDNKKNVDNYEVDATSVIVASIKREDRRKIEGQVREVRASSNENEIVIVVKPLAGAIADIGRNKMKRSKVTIMRGLVQA